MKSLVEKLLITALVVTSCLLTSCHKIAYGSYNVGVCIDNGNDFVESHVVVDKKAFTIVANATGSKSIHVMPNPIVLNFVKQAGGVLKYEGLVDGHTDTVLFTLKNGVLEGQFLVNGVQGATIHGHLGTIGNVGRDGAEEFQNCGATH